VTELERPAAGASLVLSLFPGIDLLGRGFESEGFAVVRGPDLIFGGDIRTFSVPHGRFDGVIAGSPCQDFSRARRAPATGDGVAMLAEFCRLVFHARPSWWLLENVAGVPDVMVPGYSHCRIDLDARDCGLHQIRPRVFQFGHAAGMVPIVTRRARAAVDPSRCAMASEFSRPHRRGWPEFCELQGLPRDFELPGFTLSARYRAVGNGVPLPMARMIAAAVRDARALVPGESVCRCGCGRIIAGRRELATVACRKRAQRKRDAAAVTVSNPVTPTTSRLAVTDRAPGDGAPSPLAWSVTPTARLAALAGQSAGEGAR